MKRPQIILTAVILLLWGTFPRAFAQEWDSDYINVTLERADKIVATLDITDPVTRESVKQTIAKQYRDLSDLHEKQDGRKAGTKEKWKANPDKLKKKLDKLSKKSEKESDQLKRSFITGLSHDLDGEQIAKVKDGLTYSVAPNTYKVYLQMLPELTAAQREHIWENLIEAREKAMMAGTSKKKHGWFGKYKGRINNYLAAEGYDLKKASETMEAAMSK
ncbi:DUF3826 domain-containing protein [Negadavirga shengliensis]|uniref:DUF3826 domain-containing protein n=1 Tax=Negadavirga shengliensis TaxID=1389218 RepID=A0ABV9T523_9BACT